MKLIIGFTYLAIVVVYALVYARRNATEDFRKGIVAFFVAVPVIYLGTIVCGGLIWVFAMIGIWLRDEALWLIEAILLPFTLLLSLF